MTFHDDRLHELFAPVTKQFIAIVGDVMLDRYIWGETHRISPEAPVPIVDVRRESNHPGGAANVALNIRSLGAIPVLFGTVGDDSNANDLRRIFEETQIMTDFLVVDSSRPTTVKTRIIAGSQHVVRIDFEQRSDIDEESARRLLDKLEDHISSLHIIILQDYNKGVLRPELIQKVIQLANDHDVPVLVDPKDRNFFAYQDVAVFKPNRKETEDALGIALRTEEEFLTGARKLHERVQCGNVLLTLGEHGMLLMTRDGAVTRIPTRARKVADVSGAGDTVIATLAAMLAAGATIVEAAQLANLAGGLVCEEVGIIPVQRDTLYDAALGDPQDG